MISSNTMEGFLIVLLVIAAVIGWAVIESVIWVFSHISIVWK